MTGMVRARHTLEFKQEAVRLVRGGQSLSSAARGLGVSAQSIDNWVKADAIVLGAANGSAHGPFPQVPDVGLHDRHQLVAGALGLGQHTLLGQRLHLALGQDQQLGDGRDGICLFAHAATSPGSMAGEIHRTARPSQSP